MVGDQFFSYSYWPTFIWGLVVLLSFYGWGYALRLVTRTPASESDWALTAAWGMAGMIAIGGALALFSLALRPVLVGVVLIGAAFSLPGIRDSKRDWISLAVLASTLALWYVPAVAWREFEPYDDGLAYFTFAKRLLQEGTLIEPFSLRRLATYGGQSLLHAVTTCFGSEKNMNLMDAGIAPAMVAGLVFGYSRWLGRSTRVAIAAVAAAMLVPILRHNTMSQTTGLLLWFALFRTMTLPSHPWLLTGLTAAGLCSLRSNYIAAVVAALALYAFLNRNEWRRMALAAGAAVVSILPWTLLLFRSSGSLVYPLFRGFQRPDFTYAAWFTFADRFRSLWSFVANPNTLFFLIPLLIVCRTRTVRPFAAAAVLVSLLISFSLPATDYATVLRYSQPLLLGALLAAVWFFRGRTAAVLGIAAMPLMAIYAAMTVQHQFSTLTSVTAQIKDGEPLFGRAAGEMYREAQWALPAGATLYAVVPQPSLLDYRRQRIFNADLIGAASPPPGMPFFRGAGDLKAYLRAHGVEYILYNDFDQPRVQTGYWRAWWRDAAPKRNPTLGPLVVYAIDLMRNIDALANTEEIIFRRGDLRVIRLRAGLKAPPWDAAAPAIFPTYEPASRAARPAMPDSVCGTG